MTLLGVAVADVPVDDGRNLVGDTARRSANARAGQRQREIPAIGGHGKPEIEMAREASAALVRDINRCRGRSPQSHGSSAQLPACGGHSYTPRQSHVPLGAGQV